MNFLQLCLDVAIYGNRSKALTEQNKSLSSKLGVVVNEQKKRNKKKGKDMTVPRHGGGESLLSIHMSA